MNTIRIYHCIIGKLTWLLLAAVLMQPAVAVAATEDTFAVLETKTGTYKNVTVTRKTEDYIMIMHATGLCSITIPELSPDIQKQLGYGPESQRAKASTASAWTNRKFPSINVPQVKQLEQMWREHGSAEVQKIVSRPELLYGVLGIAALAYLFFCYCSMLICQKTRNAPGVLVWVPVLQLFPLLRAAGMSPVWFLAYLVPVVNILAHIVWSAKIAQARGKSQWVALFLLLPGINLLAFLYLAFSSAAPAVEDKRAAYESMALQTA